MSTRDIAIAAPRKGFRARVRDFFYTPEVPYGIALARIMLPLVLLFVMVPRWHFARELFSTDGAPISLWDAYGTHPWVPNPSGAVAVAIHSLVILTLVTSCLGWCTRLSLILTTAGYVYLNMLEIITTMNKYSAISSNVLFLLCFSQCGSLWSIDNWLRRSRLARQGVPPELVDQPRRFPATSRRLLQLFIAAVYIGAATTKLHVPTYFTGEQLATWMITEYNAPNFLGSRFAMYPSLLVAFAYIALAWETLFIFIAWRGLGRIAIIGLGLLFHMMTWLTLGLWIFPLVCYSTYLSFLNENDVERIRGLLARWRARGASGRGAPVKKSQAATVAGTHSGDESRSFRGRCDRHGHWRRRPRIQARSLRHPPTAGTLRAQRAGCQARRRIAGADGPHPKRRQVALFRRRVDHRRRGRDRQPHAISPG